MATKEKITLSINEKLFNLQQEIGTISTFISPTFRDGLSLKNYLLRSLVSYTISTETLC